MNNPVDTTGYGDWIYLKLYLGRAIDRMDQLIVKLGQSVPALTGVTGWFYIRYFDETGVHIRLRARPRREDEELLKNELSHLCANSLNTLHELVAGTYYPMVVPAGFEEAMQRESGGLGNIPNDVTMMSDQYEPEIDKYGGPMGIRFAEDVFQTSSEVACRMLADEASGLYSRKDLIPLLMSDCVEAFVADTDEAAFWREYSFYWLGGNTPAAGDWREKFFEKSAELTELGIPVVPDLSLLPSSAREVAARWRNCLDVAVLRYRDMASVVDANHEVLSFNFAHLMNNRLGISSLEEAYMATLLERRASHSLVAA
ncbi:MAG: lantibiotic dehydratase C-terminal domain-containing protein [Rhodanobacter sp.]